MTQQSWFSPDARFVLLFFAVVVLAGIVLIDNSANANPWGVPVAPGMVRYYEPATARHIYVCTKPCAVVQFERSTQ